LIILVISAAVAQSSHSQLRSVKVKRPNIVVRGRYLSKVEVWAVPTGTGITENEYTLLGEARRTSAAGSNEAWVFPLDCKGETRLLATEIFVGGFDSHGKGVGSKSLPYKGATEVYEALCGKQSPH
jgi:hypothetical protein